MNTKEKDLKQISFLLGSWIAAIRLQNAISYFDINRVSQGVAQELLNLIYGYELEELDNVQKNFPGLDLGELQTSGVAFQVTSRTDTAKVISTLEKVASHKLQDKFPKGIKFFILREGEEIKFGKKTDPKVHLPSFDPAKDIIYPETITVEISKIYDADDLVTILKIKELAERHIRPNLDNVNDQSSDKISAMFDVLNKRLDEMQSQNKAETTLVRRDETRFPTMKCRSKRFGLVTSYMELLGERPLLWITGANSTGKTNLAYLIGKANGTEKLWIDFRGIEVDQLLSHLTIVLCNKLNITLSSELDLIIEQIIGSFDIKPMLLLNDLPSLNNLSEPDCRDLIYFFEELSACGFLLVVTSNYSPHAEIENQIGEKIFSKPIPMFDTSETKEVIKSYGAPDTLEEHVADLVAGISEGHPLIINAISKFLKEKNWILTDDNLSQLFKGEYSQSINQQTYQKILATTTDDDTIELLYRLKEVSGNITNREIEAVSSVDQQVKYPQHKILNLAEIWLQPVETNTYQLSPLVKSLSSNLDPERRKEVNLALGKSTFSNGKVTSTEAFRGIMYYIRGEAYLDAAITMISIMQKSMDSPKLFFASGFNLIWFNSQIPVQVPVPVRLFIRFLQIQLSLMEERNIDFLYSDIENLSNAGDLDDFSRGLYHFITYRIKLSKGSIDAMAHLLEADKIFPEVVRSEENENDEYSFSNAFWLTFASIKTLQDYEKWFGMFDELGLGKNQYDPETNFAYVSSGLSIAINLPIFQSNIGHEKTFEILHYVLDQALERRLFVLASYSIKCIVAALCSLDRFDEARRLIDIHKNILAEHEIYNTLIMGELAHQYFLSDLKAEAMRYLPNVVESEIPDFYTEKIEFIKDYARSTDDQRLVNLLLLKALEIVERAPDYYTPYERLNLYGEIGISYLNLEEYEKSMDWLEMGYDIVYNTYEDNDNFKCLVIRYGHTANYISQFIISDYPFNKDLGEDNAVPVQGFFYFNNDKLLESGFYFEERRYLNALLFKTAYEYIGNYEIARKWAMESMQVIVNIQQPKFGAVLNTCIFYLIKDGAFKKALNVYLFIKKRRTLEATGKFENDLAKASNMQIAIDDVVFYEHILIPIIYVQTLELLRGTIEPIALYAQLNEIFEQQGMFFLDVSTKDFIKARLNDLLVANIPPYKVYEDLCIYQGDYVGQVLTIGYIVLSCFTNAKDSASMQLSLLSRIDSMCKHPFIGYYKFVVFPYYEAFWLEKSKTHFDEFIDQKGWFEKGVGYFTNADGLTKFKRLFKTLIYHLEINVSSKIEDWLSE